MLLLIDQGNSSLKWCLRDDESFVSMRVGQLSELEKFIKSESYLISDIYLSSVKTTDQIDSICRVVNKLTKLEVQIAETGASYHQLQNGYDNPAQLGIDRWLAMIAVWHRIQSGAIIVDAGSALTLDIVNDSGQHLGGHIIPGLSLQKKLLLSETDGVIFDESATSSLNVPGRSTSTAVHNGCISNLIFYITQMYQQNSNQGALPLFITGGDASVLSKNLRFEHQVVTDLVLQGLYYLYQS